MTNDSTNTPETETVEIEAPAAKKAAAKKAPAKKAAAKKAPAKKATTEGAGAASSLASDETTGGGATSAKRSSAAAKKAAEAPAIDADPDADAPAPAKKAAAKKAPAKKAAAKRAPAKKAPARSAEAPEADAAGETPTGAPAALFQVPEKAPAKKAAARKAPAKKVAAKPVEEAQDDELELDSEDADATGTEDEVIEAEELDSDEIDDDEENEDGTPSPARRRRRRGGRRRRKGPNTGGNAQAGDDAEGDDDETDPEDAEGDDQGDSEETEGDGGSASSRRRRRRRRAGDNGGGAEDDPENTVVRVRESRPAEQQITSIAGSTRLEAKKQRRREGREAGRRRAPIVSEAEFLARRESVDRVMVIRQRDDLTQIAVLEDKVLVEHYVARESQTSMIGDIYLGRVQNVLPSMEAAFVDIGKGRNAVLYAGEVNWPSLGWKDGQPRKIESVLSAGQTILVQVSKDPIGHKGARLTSQISLAGRFLVYVPDGTTSGISRKLPDTERNRLKTLLKEIVPDTAGVIVRTAAEGASEDELTRDVERLKARWADIEGKSKGNAPQQLHGEPDLTLKVVRDLFTEDFSKLVIQGDEAWATVEGYVQHVAPDLEERLARFVVGENGRDAFQTYRIDEQISKGLDRKVWLPSGGSLVIDRTEAMTVIDVNTGKFTGSGGNLEETVTRNNLEAAEEVVRQLRLRDIGGIIVVDFIDMVLESNRDLVLRRMVECLGRDRTRHQVAEVTSLGLVQMTRKRIGTGLLEAFSTNCSHCQGRGVVVHDHPVEDKGGNSGNSGNAGGGEERRPRRSRGGRSGAAVAEPEGDHKIPTPAAFAAMARHEDEDGEGAETAEAPVEVVETPAEVEALTTEGADSEAPAEELAVEAELVEVAEAPVVAEPVVEVAREVPAEPVAKEVPAEPEAPKVITRTRGGARRAVVSTGEAVALVADDASPVVIETPAVSAVTTRTRGSRATDATDVVAHVPIKKKR